MVKGNFTKTTKKYVHYLEGSNVTVTKLSFTVSRKSQVTHKQEFNKGAPLLIYCDQEPHIMALKCDQR